MLLLMVSLPSLPTVWVFLVVSQWRPFWNVLLLLCGRGYVSLPSWPISSLYLPTFGITVALLLLLSFNKHHYNVFYGKIKRKPSTYLALVFFGYCKRRSLCKLARRPLISPPCLFWWKRHLIFLVFSMSLPLKKMWISSVLGFSSFVLEVLWIPEFCPSDQPS